MSFATRPSSRQSRPASSASAAASATAPPPRPPSAGYGVHPSSLTAAAEPAASLASPFDLKKRKRDPDVVAGDDLLESAVVLKPYPSNLVAKPRILHPLMLLPRECLSLSSLDLTQPLGDFPQCRFFESRIKILDLEGRLGSSNVLLARSDTTCMVYAIERQKDGLYVLCKLGAWVDIEELAQLATVVSSQRIKACKPVKLENTGVPPLTTPHLYKESKKRRMAIDEIQSIVRKRSVSTVSIADVEAHRQLPTPTEKSPEPAESDKKDADLPAEPAEDLGTSLSLPTETRALSVPVSLPGDDQQGQPNAQDIFQNIRAQYFEALYHSMGSLAYFAKGPLSRARAAFHLDCDSSLDMNDLIDFLRSLVMTTIIIDKKYRETVPSIISTMKTLMDESDKGELKSKKKKAKPPKLGKDGLYPSEINHVRRWWSSKPPSTSGEEEKGVTATETKYHISCLRRRETQLQMIIILEILALEPLARPAEAREESQLPGMTPEKRPGEPALEAPARKRNKTNISTLLDVHADRLCIWQSTTLDEVKALTESQVPQAGQEAQGGDSDPLRDFCVEIIIPFFAARLPELCESINRKLGGPVIQAPARKEHPHKPAVSKSKPGAPAKRSSAVKKDKERTLERVLSTERMRRSVSRGPLGAIALMRSASATTIPGLKREGSEPLMGMIPRTESGSFKEKTTAVFSQSLSSLKSTEDAKAKKKAQVEAELRGAISALKKPNRALAGKELVEEAEKRAFTSGPQPPKKLKKPTRTSGVQIKATPVSNRFKDVLGTQAGYPDPSGQHDTEVASPAPPSSSMIVPSSSAALKFSNIFATSSGNANRLADRVQVTPSRNSVGTAPKVQFSAQEDVFAIQASSPFTQNNTTAVDPPPSKAHLEVPERDFGGRGNKANNKEMIPLSPGLIGGLFETPINPRSSRPVGDSLDDVLDDTPIKPRAPLFALKGGVTRTKTTTTKTTTTTLADGRDGGVLLLPGEKKGSIFDDDHDNNNDDDEGKENVVGVEMEAKTVPPATTITTTTTSSRTNIYQRLGWDDDFDDLA